MNFLKKITRRSFIKKGIIAIVSLELIYLFVNLLRKSGDAQTPANLFEAGDIDLFEKGKVYPYSSELFYLSCLKDGGFLAISTKCTHLGCTVNFQKKEDKFLCPCHASAFNKHGEVLAPPATRALDLYPITISKNKIWVDTSKPQRRNKYDQSQITYA
ncbi:MAG: ubiquinol-cytochrome c reductase iron-sulfur subunit [Carboxylicivirga sp.]|jgi:Rieske Fe-S protein|nr:ubiquinol-cytochrome c reductase iron-sulfur subunit [Carboxylicivirga sp.]